MRIFLIIVLGSALISCGRTVYVVRHAEKVTIDSAGKVPNDPPLSEAGKVRALVLKDELADKNISHIYSTNAIRTRSTAEPLANAIKVTVERYSNIDSLVSTIRSGNGNVLVVGHSDTVDDIVNKLCGRVRIAANLKDDEYDNLFVVKLRGKKAFFERRKYGYPSNP